MNQSELVDKVAQKTTLTQAAATEAVKAAVQAMLESLVAGEPVQLWPRHFQCDGTACARRAESANGGED